MDDPIDDLVIAVRASTEGFARDVANMRATFDGTLVDGLSRAGGVLERGLLGAIRRGSLGFDDLKRVALNTVNDIAGQALQSVLSGPGGAGGGGLLQIGSLVGSLLGLPGRATGGPVVPGQAYVVGERGPEIFVPSGAGRIDNRRPGANAGSREVRVSINVVSPKNSSAPQALQRSSRQVASAVRRALLSD